MSAIYGRGRRSRSLHGPVSTVLAALACLGAGRAAAHPVVADGVISEWVGALPAVANLGHVSRTGAGFGEYVWRDAPNDERTDLGPSGTCDLTSLAITATAGELAFRFAVREGQPIVGSGTLFQVTVDLDRSNTSGQPFLGRFADTSVPSLAEWEFLIVAEPAAGTATTYDQTFTPMGVDPAAASPAGDVEVVIPWSRFALAGPPAAPIRFTVSSYAADAAGNTVDIGGPTISNAIDALTEYNDPRSTAHPNTWDEVSNQVLDRPVDVWFQSNGEVYSPFLISEVLYDPFGTEDLEWIELVNVSGATQGLDYKVGDASAPDAGEAMGLTVGPTIPAGSGAMIARNGFVFASNYGMSPYYESINSSAGIPDLFPFPAWAPSIAFQLANTGDEVLLIDRWNTVIDVLAYGTGAWPGNPARALVPEGHSLERYPSNLDTDQPSDFRDRTTPSPGALVAVPGRDVSGVDLGPAIPNPARHVLAWRLAVAREQRVVAEVFDAAGRCTRRLLGAPVPAGEHTLRWDLRDASGRTVANGLYFLRVSVEGVVSTRSGLVMR
jgi:hypothetical protein